VLDSEKRQLNRDLGARVAVGFQLAVALKLVLNSLARIFSQVRFLYLSPTSVHALTCVCVYVLYRYTLKYS